MRILSLVSCIMFILSVPAYADGAVRTYYISADKVHWDYTPRGKNMLYDRPFNEEEMFYLGEGNDLLGSKLYKAQYREYSDASFTKLKPRGEAWQHLGLLGPLIRAEVGDTIKIIFKNNTHFPATMHPHGVFYLKDSEGAPYSDGTSGDDKKDDAVLPGGTHTYTWNVPDRAGPKGGRSTAFWMYHSHADEAKDVNSGLMGPMIITARGMARDDLSPKDLDKEFIVLFSSTEEASSWYLHENIETYYENPDEVSIVRDPFGTPNIVYDNKPSLGGYENLNGYLFGNMPMMIMKQGEKVRWYLMAGTNFDLHAPHWHANSGVMNGMSVDTTSLTTMGMNVVDMEPDAVGVWMFHCHVAGHFRAGMNARYQVLP